MKLKPLGDRVIIKKVEPHEEKTQSGIIIMRDDKKEKPKTGEVIAIGPGRVLNNGERKEINDVQVGQKVLFEENFNSPKISKDETGEEYFILKAEDILAIVVE